MFYVCVWMTQLWSKPWTFCSLQNVPCKVILTPMLCQLAGSNNSVNMKGFPQVISPNLEGGRQWRIMYIRWPASDMFRKRLQCHTLSNMVSTYEVNTSRSPPLFIGICSSVENLADLHGKWTLLFYKTTTLDINKPMENMSCRMTDCEVILSVSCISQSSLHMIILWYMLCIVSYYKRQLYRTLLSLYHLSLCIIKNNIWQHTMLNTTMIY